MSVTILDHALIQHKLTIMRDKNTSTYIFKQNLDEIAKLMAFEVTRNVSLKDKAIDKAKELKEGAESKASELKDKAVDKATELKEGTEKKASELKDKISEGADSLINKIK